MAAEAPSLDRLAVHRPSRAPLSRRQIDTLASRAVAAFGVVFALQTVPVAIEQVAHGHEQHLWSQLVAAMLILTLLAMCVASIVQRWVRVTAGTFTAIYILSVLSWPLANRTPLEGADGAHWLYYLLTVATGAAVIAFPTRYATAYLFVAPVIYAFSGWATGSGIVPGTEAVLGAIYSILLGGVALVIITMLRHAASTVDRAQVAALDSYAEAVRAHAREVERVQVDSIVHDSVLTTLLSAARARTPETSALAATMAHNAIGFLRHAALIGPAGSGDVPIAQLAAQLARAASSLDPRVELRFAELPARDLPAPVAEAVQAGAIQAFVNSTQHAGDRASRWLSVRGVDEAGVIVEVGDTGRGFDLSGVPAERLGLRVSILERLSKAGGSVEIDTQPGEGTVVSLRWPAP